MYSYKPQSFNLLGEWNQQFPCHKSLFVFFHLWAAALLAQMKFLKVKWCNSWRINPLSTGDCSRGCLYWHAHCWVSSGGLCGVAGHAIGWISWKWAHSQKGWEKAPQRGLCAILFKISLSLFLKSLCVSLWEAGRCNNLAASLEHPRALAKSRLLVG